MTSLGHRLQYCRAATESIDGAKFSAQPVCLIAIALGMDSASRVGGMTTDGALLLCLRLEQGIGLFVAHRQMSLAWCSL
jgi:hypothetical protein